MVSDYCRVMDGCESLFWLFFFSRGGGEGGRGGRKRSLYASFLFLFERGVVSCLSQCSAIRLQGSG